MPAKYLLPALAACGVAAWLATGRVQLGLVAVVLPAAVVAGIRLWERGRR